MRKSAFRNLSRQLPWLLALSLAAVIGHAQNNSKRTTARMSVSATSGAAPLSVNFDGSGSTGTISSYTWQFGDGATATGATATHVYSTAGSFTARLTTTGPKNTSTAYQTITVTATTTNPTAPTNAAPVVSAGAAQTIQLPNAAALAGSATDDGLPSNTLTTTWRSVSGPGSVTFGNANALSTTASFSASGTYQLQLTASDTQLSSSATVQVTVNPAATAPVNVAPKVSAGAAQTIQLPNTAALAGSATDDGLPSNTLTTTWKSVSGPGTVTFGNANALSTTASFSAAGTYSLQLTASDTALSSSATVQVTVNAAATTPPPPTGAIVIYPGTSIQNVVNANSAGSTYLLKAGVHRLQGVTPKTNDVYLGEAGTIMNGAKVLTMQQEGQYWVAYNQTQRGLVHGECRAGHPRCAYSDDLYIDNRFLEPVDNLAAVTAGKWFFDYGASKIYMADNPTGHTVEATVVRNAFAGSATGVTIRGMIIEKYSSPAQMGAIGDQYPSAGWIIDQNEIRFNHGVGAMVSDRAQVTRNNVHHNGQMGLGGNGANVLVEGNEIAYNNMAFFNEAWEAGGTKFCETTNLMVRNNYSHHNNGTGLWTDINNIYTTYDGNTMEDNTGGGISHEISYDVVIKNNVVKRSGPAYCSWLWGGAIQIQNSQNAEIYNNKVVISATGCGNGITLMQQYRGDGRYGPYVTINNHVYNNSITHLGGVGASGGAEDYTSPDVFASSSNNTFDYNNYHVPNATQGAWAWSNSLRDWSGFRSYNLEAHGTVDSNIIP